MYEGFHEGWYCVADEAFVPAGQASQPACNKKHMPLNTRAAARGNEHAARARTETQTDTWPCKPVRTVRCGCGQCQQPRSQTSMRGRARAQVAAVQEDGQLVPRDENEPPPDPGACTRLPASPLAPAPSA